MRRPETCVGWRVMHMDPPGARGRGRPKKRWKDVVGEDMKEKGVEAGYVNDRRWWRELIRNSDPT